VFTRNNYVRNIRKMSVNKSRSKTVRGVKCARDCKDSNSCGRINKCVIKDFAVESWTGYSVNNPLKVNQDNYLTYKDLLEHPDKIDVFSSEYEKEQLHLFAVCDGHGDDGKSVSAFIKSKLPLNIKKGFRKGFLSIPEVVEFAINKTDTDIKKANVDSYQSGSTLTGVIIKGNSVFPFNVGDSRCIMIKFASEEGRKEYYSQINSRIISINQNEEQKGDYDNRPGYFIHKKSVMNINKVDVQNDESQSQFEAEPLTFDHTCDVDREQRRILEYGGRVDKVKLS